MRSFRSDTSLARWLIPGALLAAACSGTATTGPLDASTAVDAVTPTDQPALPDVPVTPTDAVTPTDRATPPSDVVTPTDGGTPPGAPTAVTTFQFDLARTGANRTETRLTPDAVRAGFGRDTAFNVNFDGLVYAQPLYLPGVMTAQGRKDLLYVMTQANTAAAIDASTGAFVWTTPLGTPVPRSTQSCGNITNTTGILGTPVIDPATNTLYAVSFVRDGSNNVWRSNALDVASGQQRPNYPADITATAGGFTLDGRTTQERGALAFHNGRVLVPFGGLYGDCGMYHGWVVSIDAANPSQQTAFVTPGRGSGIWAPGGMSLDEMGRVYVATGNSTPLGGHTPGSYGEYVIRLGAGALAFDASDTGAWFSPSNARGLDLADLDIGSVAPMLLPRATGGRRIVIQGGKAGVVHALDGDALGGVGTGDGTLREGLASARLFSGGIFGANAAFRDGARTLAFIAGRGRSSCTITNGGVMAVTVPDDGSALMTAWCTANIANPSPPAVSSNGDRDAILWVTGVNSPLYAYSVADGTLIWQSSGAENPSAVRQWTPVVVADGRVFVTGQATISMYRLR